MYLSWKEHTMKTPAIKKVSSVSEVTIFQEEWLHDLPEGLNQRNGDQLCGTASPGVFYPLLYNLTACQRVHYDDSGWKKSFWFCVTVATRCSCPSLH